jgi:N-acetylneuraminate synthase
LKTKEVRKVPNKRHTDDLIFIAEVGINHNGRLDLALELIEHAAVCGCDMVKFQKRTPELCVPDHQKDIVKYDTPWGDITYLEYKHKIEFGKKEYDAIDAFCREGDMFWTASAWDLPSVEFLSNYDLAYHKVCSPCLTNPELLESIASQQKHTFISTGMSTMEEIEKAVSVFQQHQCSFELMHCVSSYPMKNEDANLSVMQTLRDKFHCLVGYSGHEVGLQITMAAVALGATSVERHITLSRSMWGSDQAASLGKSGLQRLVRDCRIIKRAIGDGVKRVLECEEKKRKSLRLP